jgi:hypothetical protein
MGKRPQSKSLTLFWEPRMEPRILEEIRKHSKQEVIDFDWEPIRRQPKRYGILYPIIGYIVSLLAIIFMGLGVFIWLFLIAGSILFFGGIFCANGIIGEYGKIRKNAKNQGSPSRLNFGGRGNDKAND